MFPSLSIWSVFPETITAMSSSQDSPEPLSEPLPQRPAHIPPSPILTFPLPHDPTTTLTIRAWFPLDTLHLPPIASNPLISSRMRNTFPYPYTLQDAHNWVRHATTSFSDPLTKPTLSNQPLHLNYAILLNGELIGDIGLKPLFDIESETFEIGYWIAESAWGRGIMTAVVREFITWVWEQFPTVRRLEAQLFDFNEQSKRVLVKNGFVREGVRREAVVKAGKVWDMEVWGLLRREWTTQVFSISSAES
ncbi:acyl-CoA N-acyltransferase [Apiosordaria backusii]|uniref:Acyl-CoA N-acyltransferase n=1 Tax=Apiosordaria backusii TaxID=314023 RepID=A0AA40EYX2_9PEZI|nr:acyl-CoA N-acyltransferase [Apiosordaria backusii]